MSEPDDSKISFGVALFISLGIFAVYAWSILTWRDDRWEADKQKAERDVEAWKRTLERVRVNSDNQ
jgi:hypothetical protein